MIGYECFVGLLTAKGDIHLREAGNNCERGHEPLNVGMKLTQVSKCLREPRIRWRSETTKKPRRKITALPSWKERELNSNMVGYGTAATSASAGFGWVLFSLVLTCLARWKTEMNALFFFFAQRIENCESFFLKTRLWNPIQRKDLLVRTSAEDGNSMQESEQNTKNINRDTIRSSIYIFITGMTPVPHKC